MFTLWEIFWWGLWITLGFATFGLAVHWGDVIEKISSKLPWPKWLIKTSVVIVVVFGSVLAFRQLMVGMTWLAKHGWV